MSDSLLSEPTVASEILRNLIERFFGDISQQAICNGSFRNVRELSARIETYIAEHNLDPKRYIWKAEGQKILAKIQRAREKLDTV